MKDPNALPTKGFLIQGEAAIPHQNRRMQLNILNQRSFGVKRSLFA